MSHEKTIRNYVILEKMYALDVCQETGEEVKKLFDEIKETAHQTLSKANFDSLKEDYEQQINMCDILMESWNEEIEEIKRTTVCLTLFKNKLKQIAMRFAETGTTV